MDVGGVAKATGEASVTTVLWSRPWLVGAAGPGSTSPSLSGQREHGSWLVLSGRAQPVACLVKESAAHGLTCQREHGLWFVLSRRPRFVACQVKESVARGLSGQGK